MINELERTLLKIQFGGLSREQLLEVLIDTLDDLMVCQDLLKEGDKLLKEAQDLLEKFVFAETSEETEVTGSKTKGKNSKPVIVVKASTGDVYTFPSITVASKELGISAGGISDVANGKSKSSTIKGYIVNFL